MPTTVANGNTEQLSVATSTAANTRSFAKSIATNNISRLTATQTVSTNSGFTSRLASLSNGHEENIRKSQETKVLCFIQRERVNNFIFPIIQNLIILTRMTTFLDENCRVALLSTFYLTAFCILSLKLI